MQARLVALLLATQPEAARAQALHELQVVHGMHRHACAVTRTLHLLVHRHCTCTCTYATPTHAAHTLHTRCTHAAHTPHTRCTHAAHTLHIHCTQRACPYQQQYHQQQQFPSRVQVSWRRCFVDALQPSRLPQGWSVEHAASSLPAAAGAGAGAWQGVHERLASEGEFVPAGYDERGGCLEHGSALS